MKSQANFTCACWCLVGSRGRQTETRCPVHKEIRISILFTKEGRIKRSAREKRGSVGGGGVGQPGDPPPPNLKLEFPE